MEVFAIGDTVVNFLGETGTIVREALPVYNWWVEIVLPDGRVVCEPYRNNELKKKEE